jgi:hypothetical protein
MDKETQKIYIVLIVATIIFAGIGFYLGLLDNGPSFF